MLLLVGDRNNSKELIVQILSEEWPLNLKKIHSKMRKQGKCISYQAVHKTLKEMVTNNILEKTGKEYKISTNWLYLVEKTCSNIKSRYASNSHSKADSCAFETLWPQQAY